MAGGDGKLPPVDHDPLSEGAVIKIANEQSRRAELRRDQVTYRALGSRRSQKLIISKSC